MKEFVDKRSKARESQIQVGDHVLVQTPKDNKLPMPFNIQSDKVIPRKGNMVTAQ